MSDKKITIYPSSISQPNQNERHPITNWSFLEVRRGGKSYNLGSANPKDPRYFHAWSNVSELKNGGKAQCGRKSTYHCSHKTYYSIKGYRNTCPIAGCNGTYNTPATLQLNLSASDLKKKGIDANSDIKKITISFQHRCSGVDVANGKESYIWGPNFYGYNVYPKLKVLKLFFTDNNGERVSQIITKKSNGEDFSNPPLSSSFEKSGTVTAIFTDVSYDDLKNGSLNIVYGRNLSTNPGNIYISAPKFTIEFNNAKESISGKNNKDTLYTSKTQACQSSIIQTISVGYKSGNKWVKTSDAPKDFTKDDITITKPKNVKVTFKSKNDRELKYEVIDESGITGNKTIKYEIKHSSKSVSLKYKALSKTKPNIILDNQLKYDLNENEINNQLIVKNGCCSDIKVYADDLSNLIKHIKSNDLDYNNTNILKRNTMVTTLQAISQLTCGRHEIHFVIDNESTSDMTSISVDILPRNYAFKFSTNPEGINENSFYFTQDKNDSEETIYIKRVDDEVPNTPPKFVITENTLNEHRVPHSTPTPPTIININEAKEVSISKFVSGNYYISIKEINDSCRATEDIRNIYIEPYHKQNHDFIFVRGEDSTSFDYDYLVGWEGDEIREPIDVSNIELICKYDDIKICANPINTTGISKAGIAKIKISNQSEFQKDFKNIRIELNILRKNEDDILENTTDEFFIDDGMLLNFVENFNIVNEGILDNVNVLNLTQDDDLEDEENIYIHIQELEYEKTIIINIPFTCRTDKEIFIQPLIFGEPMKVYPYTNCSGNGFDYITLRTYDSSLTNMEILGQMDYLEPNITNNYISGEAEDQCPNECFITKNNLDDAWYDDDGGITYRIQNIDSNTITSASTIIHNDENLIPFAFIYYKNGEKYTKLIDNNYAPNEMGDKVYWKTSKEPKQLNVINSVIKAYVNFPNTEEQIIMKRTDSHGRATFLITIPEYMNKSYTVSSLLKEALCFVYEGNEINKEFVLGKWGDSVNNYFTNKTTETQEKITNLNEIKNQLDPSSTQYLKILNTIDKLENDNRNRVTISYINNYKKYNPGESVEITINVESEIMETENNIIFKPDINNPGDIDEIVVFYKVCNLERNIGILNTNFKTNTYHLIDNEVNKNIYFGIDTHLSSKAKIEKRIVEQNTLNVIYVYLNNEIRDNKDIRCIIDLGSYPDYDLNGSYDFINIDMEDGDYNLIVLDEENYKHLLIEWNVGEMVADTETRATIILKGHEIGLSEILIDTYDYLHDGTEKEYHFGEYLCDCRKE